ncbi:MAG: hypothetical protein R3E68_12910 [Burkholderiaceae bacterium]
MHRRRRSPRAGRPVRGQPAPGRGRRGRYLALLAEAQALDALARLDVPLFAVIDRTPGPAEMALALHCRTRIVRAGAAIRFSLGHTHPADLPACGTWCRAATLLEGPALAALVSGGTLDADAARQAGLVQRVLADGAPLATVLTAVAISDDWQASSPDGEIHPPALDLAPVREAAMLEVLGAAQSLPAPMAMQIEARELARLADHPQLAHQRRHWLAQAAASRWSAALAEQVEQQYLFEGMALLGDAVPADQVEALASLGGMRQGPLRGLDEMSLKAVDALLHARMDDHGHDHDHDHGHGHKHAHDHDHDHEHQHGHDHAHEGDVRGDHTHHRPAQDHRHEHVPATDALPWMPASAVYVMEKMAHGLHREGRPTGGFYDWPAQGGPQLWSGLSVFARGRPKATPAQAAERLLLISPIQALRVLARHPDARSSTWDAARPPGLSFPGWAGGPLGWIEWIGREAFARRCEAIADTFGERYRLPADWIHLMPGQA